MVFRVLLFGGNGQLGSACRPALKTDGVELLALDRTTADFADPDAVYDSVIDARPDFVVNACAYTAVDKAESESDLAYRVNALSVGRMAEACAALAIPTLHVSTDYVFSGQSTRPYREGDTVGPIGVYGASKLDGESRLCAANGNHIILRTSWVFGEHGNNFVKTMLRLGRERSELGVVADQLGCPTYAGDLAAVIGEFVDRYRNQGSLPWGVYHCSNSGTCSWYDFAQAIFEQGQASGLLSKTPRVNPLTTDQYPTLAARPAYSVLDCHKLEGLLGRPMPSWKVGLEKLCRALAN